MIDASLQVTVGFIASTVLAIALFLRAVPRWTGFLLILTSWTALQGAIAGSGFYLVTDTLPPRMALALVVPIVCIMIMAVWSKGRSWARSLDLRALTFMHVVRVPVEWGLHQLFLEGSIPQVMTFEGRNFDILSGLSAPLIAWLAFRDGRVNRRLLLMWNVVCLGLLVAVVTQGVLSLPTPFQRFGFEQPNVALLYFPFIWLPSVIVPLVFLGHVVALLRLVRK